MSESNKSASLVGRVAAVGLLVYAYEIFRPPTMPSLQDQLGIRFPGLTESDPVQQEAPAAGPSFQQAPAQRSTLDGEAYDAYVRRRDTLVAVNHGFDDWIRTYMLPQCDAERADLEARTEAARKLWGMRRHVPQEQAPVASELRITDAAIEALHDLVVAGLSAEQRAANEELVGLLEHDWQLFMRDILRVMSGTEAHSYTVPYMCSDATDGGAKWPWGANMTLRRLREQTVANYRAMLR